jgi:ClpP class serine protease
MSILLHLLHSKWAISREFVATAHGLVQQILSERQEWGEPKALINPMSAINVEGNGTVTMGKYDRISDVPAGSIVAIDIAGPMTHADQFCGPMGTASLARLIEAADASPKVEAIILSMSTPGGQVLGTEALAKVIESTKKPIYSHVNMACSAGYWCAAASDEIWMSGKSSEVGSIGVMCSFIDMKGVWEKEGAKVHSVYPKTSGDKNRSFREALDGNYEALEVELEDLDQVFMSEMKRLRKGLDKSALSGATYLANEAIKLGLADRIGTMADLAKYIKSKNKNSNTAMGGGKGLMSFFSSVKNEEEAQAIDNKVIALQNDLEKAQATVASNQAELAKAKGDLEAKEKELAQTKAELEATKKERDDYKSQAEKYGKQPGALGTDAMIDNREADGGEKPKSYYKPDAAHNAEANRILKK